MKENNFLQSLLLTRYDYDGASSRYRFFQFVPHLKREGIDCVVSPFFDKEHVNQRFDRRGKLGLRIPSCFQRRLKTLRRSPDFDVILVEKELFPYVPAMLETSILPPDIPLLLDYDDAIFHMYDAHESKIIRWVLGDKIARLMRKSAGIIAGSRYIFEYAARHHQNVHFLPTVIDLARYPDEPPISHVGEPFTIGWIGSPSTLTHLKMIESLLEEFCTTHDARVVVIGAGSEMPAIRSLQKVDWSESTEVDDLSRIDVGVMPLPDSPWARGKCALKLIQYMGCWKPTVASRVGENMNVVEEGVDGFLATTEREWIDALDRLYRSPELRDAMGRAGRRKVAKEYVLSSAIPKMAGIIRKAVKEFPVCVA